MIIAFVRNEPVPDVKDNDCDDVKIVHNALETLRFALDCGKNHEFVTINVKDCGAALRFLLSLAANLPLKTLITGTDRLLERPIEPLVAVWKNVGVDVSRQRDGWLVIGKKNDVREVEIDAEMSSQFASSLLLVAPLMNLKVLKLKNIDIPSLPYLRLTLNMIQPYRVEIPDLDCEFAPLGELGDWSAAVFWFAFCRLHPEFSFRLSPLSINSAQGDSVIVQWFRQLNLSVTQFNNEVFIKAEKLDAQPKLVLDVKQNLDLVPVMAALACKLPASFSFFNVKNLKYKESDRLIALVSQLSQFCDLQLTENELHINPSRKFVFNNIHLNTMHDHRNAMAFLLLTDEENLSDVQCISKSYPDLLSQLRSIKRYLNY